MRNLSNTSHPFSIRAPVRFAISPETSIIIAEFRESCHFRRITPIGARFGVNVATTSHLEGERE